MNEADHSVRGYLKTLSSGNSIKRQRLSRTRQRNKLAVGVVKFPDSLFYRCLFRVICLHSI